MNIIDKIDVALMEAENVSVPEQIIMRIQQHILDGESKLKVPLANGQATLNDVVRCIQNERCLCTKERDLGSSYLEQVLSKAIREVVPLNNLNAIRQLFGLVPLSDDELKELIQKSAADQNLMNTRM